jgi:hypothetical protein
MTIRALVPFSLNLRRSRRNRPIRLDKRRLEVDRVSHELVLKLTNISKLLESRIR